MFFATDPTTTGLVVDLSPYLTQIFLAVMTAVVAFVGKAARDFIAANKDNKNYALLNDIAEVAVQAAEQLYAKQDGETKKAAAIEYAQSALDKTGIKFDAAALENAIEAAVLREFNYPAAVEPATPPAETVVGVSPSSPGDEGRDSV